MSDDPLTALGRLLDDAGIRYALIGGHAVNLWLEPRLTADIDLTIAAQTSDRLREVLHAAGLRLDRVLGESPSGPDFARFVGAGFTVEVQVAKTAFQRDVLARAIDRDGLRVATPEDLIVFKLIADRPKDQVDLLGLVALEGLDWRYIEAWAERWDVTDVLARLRAAGEPPRQ